ncbi:BRCA1-A complex subunit BRE [Microtus ochrogaster]|uniref:BRISC and BRCA1-A complex member 2 n=1 Tax=Microtus ochrogaster TaxID=79684 RepID=A0A8J6G8I5_MICOH|nr:BRCA1-A complex subunit BRE [Microtus ochrogaster]
MSAPLCNCTTVPPYHCGTAPLSHCATIPLRHCTTAPWYHRNTAPLHHCTGAHTAPLHHCIGVPLYHCTIVPMHHCTGVPLHHCTIALTCLLVNRRTVHLQGNKKILLFFYISGDIIFNAQYPELPPDFIFGEDAEFLPDPSALHNLASWNPSNPECLLLVVKELVQQYHQFQCSRLRESSRLMFEYQTLLEEPQYGENMEIYAGKKNNWTGEFSARFLLKLPVDFSNIPTYLLKDVNEDPGEDVALLSVSFEDTEATQVYPKLYLSPRIEQKAVNAKVTSSELTLKMCHTFPRSQTVGSSRRGTQGELGIRDSTVLISESALGGSSALHIPAFPGGGCLIDYVPQVCHLLTNKVQYVIQGYHKRREYIAAFLSHFGT